MRKRIVTEVKNIDPAHKESWFDLDALADVEVTSEDAGHPSENALLLDGKGGWRAGKPGPQTIRLLFRQPQTLCRLQLSFYEPVTTRTQQYALRWSQDNGLTFNEIVRQQWNFRADGSTTETEDHAMALLGVAVLELVITPDISGQEAIATLEKLRVA
jgi:hypothetical protein